MACPITSGIDLICRSTIGGVNRAYIANYDDVRDNPPTLSAVVGPAFGSVTAWAYVGPPALFFELGFSDGTGLATSDGVGGQTAGSKYFAPSVTLVIPRFDNVANQVIEQILLGKFVLIIESKTDNGNTTDPAHETFIYGLKNGLTQQAITGGLGTAPGDAAGWTIQLSGAEAKAPVVILYNDTQANLDLLIGGLL